MIIFRVKEKLTEEGELSELPNFNPIFDKHKTMPLLDHKIKQVSTIQIRIVAQEKWSDELFKFKSDLEFHAFKHMWWEMRLS